MRILSDPFDTPVTEDWAWLTNTIVSEDGTEQRIGLLDPPHRTLNVSYQTTDLSSAQRIVRNLYMSQAGFLVPAWHQQTPIADAAIGDTVIVCDPAKTELREGMQALIFSRATGAFVQVEIASVEAGGVTIATALEKAWGPRASICGMWAMSAPDNAALTRGRMDAVTSISMTLESLDFVDPFLNPANVVELDIFAGLPVVPWLATGDDFDLAFATGATVISYGAAREIRSLWKHTQQVFSRTYLVQRLFDRSRWYWFQAFADYCKGSQNPFYVPTYRPDFPVRNVARRDTITLTGLDYETDYFPHEAFKQLAIGSRAGWHYATVTAVASLGGNSVCTIDPPLPDDAAYAIDQVASLLLKCRISDDKISCEHDALQTNVTINMRTTDQ